MKRRRSRLLFAAGTDWRQVVVVMMFLVVVVVMVSVLTGRRWFVATTR